jgi:splicing suppressor protein 51
MPVEMSIICALAEPGPQSRSIETSIEVSFVLREICACLTDISLRNLLISSMTRLVASVRPCHKLIRSKYALTHRSLFNFMRKSPGTSEKDSVPTDGNLFYPFSKSPFPAIHARGEAVKGVALCPICTSPSGHVHTSTQAQIHLVKFECPDCGWPTHCTEEHWKEDEEHAKYCSRLKEVNEDEHDLRSGRQIHEFELPGACTSLGLLRKRHNENA